MKVKVNPKIFISLISIVFLFLEGCQVRGLSGKGKTTTLGYDLSKLKSFKEKSSIAKLPLHVVVAQAGSIQPDTRLIETLKQYKEVFSQVSLLPAAPELREFGQEVDQRDPKELISLAKGLGGDVLFLIGGKVSTYSSKTPASILDLVVIGHYLVPSNKIKVEGSVMGVFIDIPAQRLLFTVEEEIKKSKFSPSVSRHSNVEDLANKVIGEVVTKLGQKLVEQLAQRSGIPYRKKNSTNFKTKEKEQDSNVATVYVLSNGFHISLLFPYKEKQYIEIGLGERNWVLDQKWGWLNGIMSGLVQNEGVAVIELFNQEEVNELKDTKRRVWRVNLSEEEWGELILTLENNVALQEVLFDGAQIKVTKTVNGYHLFNTCQQFALNPLGVLDNKIFKKVAMPPPLLEDHLDQFFATQSLRRPSSR